jgi:chromosomal replication initiator protein
MPALDPRFTFDAFVVGPATRLAAAAARRVAETPGSAYNPLFIYSSSGLGKTHLVMALGQHAGRVRSELVVVYDTLEHLMEQITVALQAGEQDAFRHRLRDAQLLILDDVQFLAGRRAAQEELLRAWDTLSLSGGQVVLASDRPPTEIDDLDDRLLSRFSGGLIVDLAAPDYETRIAIVQRKAEEQQHTLAPGVAEALARLPFGNVRELQGALNRVLAIQDLDGRAVGADEVGRLFEGLVVSTSTKQDEYGSFLAEVSDAVAGAIPVQRAEQQLNEAIANWKRAGFVTRRLDAARTGPPLTAAQTDELLAAFAAHAAQLDAVAGEIRALDGDAVELTRSELLRDPDRLDEAEKLLEQVRERVRGFAAPPAASTFETLGMDPSLFALRAARAIAAQPGGAYNPFFVHGPAGSGKSGLLAAIGNAAVSTLGAAAVGFLSAQAFSAELVSAIERNRVDSWRARFRKARMLIIDDLDALAETERAQEELFHLFDDMRRAGAQFVFSATRQPRDLTGLEERLRTRLESGLVVEVAAGGTTASGAAPAPGKTAPVPKQATPPAERSTASRKAGAPADSVPAARKASAALGEPGVIGEVGLDDRAESGTGIDMWFLDAGKVVRDWPDPAEWLAEELN